MLDGALRCDVADDDALALARLIPHAHFHMLRSCGHLSPMERPGEVTQLLRDWLR